jgi:hypothetical protein
MTSHLTCQSLHNCCNFWYKRSSFCSWILHTSFIAFHKISRPQFLQHSPIFIIIHSSTTSSKCECLFH